MLHRLIPIILLASVLCSCTKSSPQELAEKAKNLGVYVQTSDELEELPTFGTGGYNEFNETVSFTFSGDIPAGNPSAFVVNMPDANIAESKVFLLPDVRSATWHYSEVADPRDPQPIPAAIEPIAPSLYRITPKELPQPAAGFFCLLLKMPLGTPDRMYAVRLPHEGKPIADNSPADPSVMASAEMLIRANPDVDLVESDAETGTLTIRNTRTGEEVTAKAKDIVEGHIQFK